MPEPDIFDEAVDAPFQIGEPMIAMSREEVARDIAVALAVIRPPVQVGRGRRQPHEADKQRQMAAAAIVEYFERRHVSWFRPAPGPMHSAP
jgi:hypothetical protein